MTLGPVPTLPALCPRCGQLLPSPGALVCVHCNALVYAAQLEQLSAEARWQEQYNPARAVELWRECLRLLPPESGQYRAVQAELDKLAGARIPFDVTRSEPGALPIAKTDPLPLAITKTLVSMLISLVIYHINFGWAGATGFVLLVLVHEMGHVVANVYYGLPASPPIFIPYLGAVINLRKSPPNARVEAVIGIAGPIAGALASLVCFGWYMKTHSNLALSLSWFGFTMNLFNLLPVPPLDGGRVAAAVSPWIWVLGIIGLAMMLVDEMKHGGGTGILFIVLIVALPRIIKTLKPSGRSGPYYAIGKVAPVLIGIAYLLILGLLCGMRWYTERLMGSNVLF